MFVFFAFCCFAVFDTELINSILDVNEADRQKLYEPDVPPEHNLLALSQLAEKFAAWIPKSVIKKSAGTIFPDQPGNVIYLKGNVVHVINHKSVFQCKMKLENGIIADVFVSDIPKDWKQGIAMQECAAAFGMYIKTYNTTPVFAAPAMRWFPNTWLGNLGFDVALLDHVPITRVIELGQYDESVNRLMFKFTEADWEPFYSLMKAVSETPPGWLEKEAKKLHAVFPIQITDLFNRPQETRGKPIVLRGIVKRIISTPVSDTESQQYFDIDGYYQLYFFPEGSQGNPIVLCVRSLPKGMPIGDDGDFAETISAAAVLYKLWIYETAAGQHYAPVLIGRSVTWHSQSVKKQRIPESAAAFSFSLFCVLVIIWFACRYWCK